MRNIKVAAAIIIKDEGSSRRLFATQRGYGDYEGWWEFPGGKIEAGETAEEAVVREIQEELNITIAIDSFFMNVQWDYPKFHLSMDCFLCHIEEGSPVLKEHKSGRWLSGETMKSVKWLPADLEIISKLEEDVFEKGEYSHV